MDYNAESLKLHKEKRGKLEVKSKFPLETIDDLSIAYTPGVAAPSIVIANDKEKVYDYTIKSNSIAVVSDGSSVLGLGNIGGEAALPVMEGKSLLFKELAGIDAFPICLTTQETDEIIKTIKNISSGFGGINLEDIAAPKCFEVEEALQDIGIPVFHDDQHGTAIVVHAALTNAAKVVEKDFSELKVVISGAGSAGTAIAKLITCYKIDNNICSSVNDVVMVDSKGIINSDRDNLDNYKIKLLEFTNKNDISGALANALENADVFIGVSRGGIATKEMIQSMSDKAIVFAMANPEPEIMPDLAREAGAAVVGTGRSDFPNQVNNILAFPGIFKGALEIRAKSITSEMKVAAAKALASIIKNPSAEKILPSPLDKSVVEVIAKAVKNAAR